MSSSKIVMVLGALLLAGFFLPWLSMGGESISGYLFAKTWLDSDDLKVLGIILFLAPVGALLALVMGAVGRAHGLIAFFTSLICPLLFLMYYIGADKDSAAAMGNSLTYGFWMSIVGSLGLLVMSFTKSESKLQPPRR